MQDQRATGAKGRAALLGLVAAALQRRQALHADPQQTAYRLFHGHGEGLPGLEIDRWGEVAFLTHAEEERGGLEALAALLLASELPLKTVLARSRRSREPAEALAGPVPDGPVTVRDGGLCFQVEPGLGRNPGLYLDARPVRAWIRAHTAGRRVLNLFAFTGSLGLAASAGGARGVIHIEQQKRALRRLAANYAANDLRLDDRDLVRADLYPWLRKAARGGRTFDAIILDPPPQVPGRSAQGAVGQDYETLAALAGALLAPGGWLLCFFSDYRVSRAEGEATVEAAVPLPLDLLWRGTSGDDYPEEDPEKKLRITAFRRPGDGTP